MIYPEDYINKIIYGDSLEILPDMPDNSVHACITDPPYALGFMGKAWDKFPSDTGAKKPFANQSRENKLGGIPYQNWCFLWAKEIFRILKPGGHLLSFGGSRTYHRMACAIEDAGFEIRDQIFYVYGSGFPKSLNIKKALEKKYGESKETTKYCLRPMWKSNLSQTKSFKEKQGEVLQSILSKQGLQKSGETSNNDRCEKSCLERRNNLQTTEGELQRCKVCSLSERVSCYGKERWLCNGTPFGYGTPHWSPTPANRSCPSYRPQSEQQRNNKSNVLPYKPSPQEIRGWEGFGTGLKPAHEPIVVARKPLSEKTVAENVLKWGTGGLNIDGCRIGFIDKKDEYHRDNKTQKHGIWDNCNGELNRHSNPQGRFPANLIHDGSDEVLAEFPPNHNNRKKRFVITENKGGWKQTSKMKNQFDYGDNGTPARFFYCAKASKSERDWGLGGMPLGEPPASARSKPAEGRQNALGNPRANYHPTVKPIALIKYLVKLVTREGQIVIDPFVGSGSTALACVELNRQFIGIDNQEEYCKIARARIGAWSKKIEQKLTQEVLELSKV